MGGGGNLTPFRVFNKHNNILQKVYGSEDYVIDSSKAFSLKIRPEKNTYIGSNGQEISLSNIIARDLNSSNFISWNSNYGNNEDRSHLYTRYMRSINNRIHIIYQCRMSLQTPIPKLNTHLYFYPGLYFQLYYPPDTLTTFYDHKNIKFKFGLVLTDNEHEINRVENQIMHNGIDSVDEKYKLKRWTHYPIKKVKHLVPEEGDDSFDYNSSYGGSLKGAININYNKDYLDYNYFFYRVRPLTEHDIKKNNDYKATKYGKEINIAVRGRYGFDVNLSNSINSIKYVSFFMDIDIPIYGNTFGDSYFPATTVFANGGWIWISNIYLEPYIAYI